MSKVTRRAPTHYSDSSLLRFYFQDVSPKLDRAAVWPGLNAKGDRLEDAACSKCSRTDTYVYADGQALRCSHLNSCGHVETILDKLAGETRPSGERLLAAITEAAKLAGVAMPEAATTPEERSQAHAWATRRAALEAALAWCQAGLWDGSDKAGEALAYLAGRGFQEAALRDLGFGFWGDTAALAGILRAGGLLQAGTDAALLLGNLAGYIVIPWHDEHGSLMTLYGRWPGNSLPTRAEHPGRWKEEENPRIPKTFALPGEGSKASPLFLDRVLRARHTEAILVEGVLDAALAQAMGDTRVAAYVAASPSNRQVEILAASRFHSLTICPDPDEGGDRGLLSSIKRITEAGIRLYVAPRLPDGKDPDELILAGGIQAWKDHIAKAVPSALILAEKALGEATKASDQKAKDEAVGRVSGVLAGLPAKDPASASDKDAIVKLAMSRLGVSKGAITGAAKATKKDAAKVQPVKAAGPASEADEWMTRLVMVATKNGSYPAKNLANAATVFAHHPAWKGVIGYDAMARRTVAMTCPPSHGGVAAPQRYPHIWQDQDDRLAAIWLQKLTSVDLDIKPEIVASAVETVAQMTVIHPIREFLNTLKWDGVSRLDDWLITYLGARIEEVGGLEYLRIIGPKWLIASVARIMQPGCQVDTMLILEGKQDIGKSSALRILAGGERYFYDDLHSFSGKDAEESLEQVWFVEVAELAATARASVEEIKSFISRRHANLRRSYGRRLEHWARQCVFAATTNAASYLKDTTGNRRFWPVYCQAVNLEALQADREQLFAEAVARYSSGETWHLDRPGMREAARDVQESRYQAHAWEQVIHDYIDHRERVSIQQLMGDALNLPKDKWDSRASDTVRLCLKRLGWESFNYRLKDGESHELRVSGGRSGQVHLYRREEREPGQD